jgi:CBS domain-containing protein
MKIKEIMTEKVITISPDFTIKDAMLLFAEHRISGAPVVDKENRIVGIVSETDVLKMIKTKNRELKMVYPSIPIMGISFVEIEKQKEVFQALGEVANVKVSEIMTKNVVTVLPTDPMEEIIPLMVKEKVNRVPVVDKDGKLVGIVTRGDILKGLYEGRGGKK